MQKTSTVTILDYQESWKENYDLLAAQLKALLGEHVVAIEHIGSTAIPNMAAKDIIDIQIGVKDFAHIDYFQDQLASIGLELIPDVLQDHVPFNATDAFEPGYEKRFFRGCYRTIHL